MAEANVLWTRMNAYVFGLEAGEALRAAEENPFPRSSEQHDLWEQARQFAVTYTIPTVAGTA